jgi:hypothetical protein
MQTDMLSCYLIYILEPKLIDVHNYVCVFHVSFFFMGIGPDGRSAHDQNSVIGVNNKSLFFLIEVLELIY